MGVFSWRTYATHTHVMVARRDADVKLLHICSSFVSSSHRVAVFTARPPVRPGGGWRGSESVWRSRPPRSVSAVSPGGAEQGGLWRVIASRCPCTSSSVWTPGLWTAPGPASSGSGPGAWCQTSWQTCSCRSDAGQSGPGRPSETPGSSEEEEERE